MDLILEDIISDDNGEVTINENGAVLCLVRDSHGKSKQMYLTTEQIDKLSKRTSEEFSSSNVVNEDEPIKETPKIKKNKTKKDDEPEIDINEPSTSTRFRWPDGISIYFLDQYIEHYRDVGPMKKFRNKQELWEESSSILKKNMDFICTPDQCENHFADIKRFYTSIEKKRNTSGNIYKESIYDGGMAMLKSLDDIIQPEILVGFGRQQRLKPSYKHQDGVEKHQNDIVDEKSVSEPKKSELVEAMYDIHQKTEKKVDKRLNKVYNLTKNVYKETHPNIQLPEEKSDSESD